MTAEQLAEAVRRAARLLPPSVRVDARAQPRLELELTLLDAAGSCVDIRSVGYPDEFVELCTQAGPSRVDAFLAACMHELATRQAQEPDSFTMDPLLAPGMLLDAGLVTEADFLAALRDAERSSVLTVRWELDELLRRSGIAPEDVTALRALHTLALDRWGRPCAELAWAVRALAQSAAGQRALLELLPRWLEQAADESALAWPGGPHAVDVLICGTWRVLDPLLRDPAERRRALAQVERLHRPVPASDLSRAGF